ncbi:MAG TPA: AAA family ATPase [Drouetiella sp.]
MQAVKKKKPTDCLAVVGTESGCGKTVLMAGVAGALREQGFKTCAVKPIALGQPSRSAEAELSFISNVSQTPLEYQQVFLTGSKVMRETAFQNALSRHRDGETLTLIELPGGTATPVNFEENEAGSKVTEWQDTATILRKNSLPCILVAKHASDAIEQLVLNAYYLTTQRISVIGMATVETSAALGAEIENKMRRDDFAMALFSRTGIPYLGCIKHSISVSVPHCNQGNLLKLTTGGLDLLAVMKALNLTVSV